MKVSVVIPAYNAAGTIMRTLSSVLSQTFTDFEMLVVDDASQDETAKLAREIPDPRMRLLQHARNLGAAAARNTGIHAAQGDWIAFLDADDVWTEDKLAVQVGFMQGNPQVGASVTSFWYETEEGPSLQILRRPASWIREFSKGCSVSPGATLMVSSFCYTIVGDYDEGMPRHEDLDWLLRFVQKYDLGVVQTPLAIVYRSDQPRGEVIGAANEIIVERYRPLFYSLGRFRGSQAVGKRWLETSIHYFMFGNRRMGYAYFWRAVKTNPFQRPTMFLRVLDYVLGLGIFLTIKKNLLKMRSFFESRKGSNG